MNLYINILTSIKIKNFDNIGKFLQKILTHHQVFLLIFSFKPYLSLDKNFYPAVGREVLPLQNSLAQKAFF